PVDAFTGPKGASQFAPRPTRFETPRRRGVTVMNFCRISSNSVYQPGRLADAVLAYPLFSTGAEAFARSSTAFRSTLKPAVRSAGLASSISLWLIPPTHGTKTIAVGATPAM